MLTTVLRNMLRPARTRALADMPAAPVTFRGALTHDASLCTACGTCAFVCAPKAITFEEDPGKSVSWLFYIGRCSFCGLCQQNCPTHAIGNTATVPVTMNSNTGDGLRLESIIPLKPCTRCGRPHIPFPTGAAGPEKDYCPDCRQWATSEGLRRAFLADDGEPATRRRAP
jgi:hydrogenase-4 component H